MPLTLRSEAVSGAGGRRVPTPASTACKNQDLPLLPLQFVNKVLMLQLTQPQRGRTTSPHNYKNGDIMGRFLFLVALCATLSGCAKMVWQDATGNGRGTPDMQMDSANCQSYAQANTPDDSSSCQKTDAASQTGCLLGAALADGLAQAISFNGCMQGRGWQQVKATEVAQAEQPAAREVADSDGLDDDADDDSDDSDTMADAKDALDAQDFTTALELYRQVADDGNAAAENNVGLFYVKGWGVPQDPKKAMHWFRKADRDGSIYAKNNLVGLRQQLHGPQRDEILKYGNSSLAPQKKTAQKSVRLAELSPHNTTSTPKLASKPKPCKSSGCK
jgi:Sel1 repeat